MRAIHLTSIAALAALTLGTAEPASAALLMKLVDVFELSAGGLPLVQSSETLPADFSPADGAAGTQKPKLPTPLASGDGMSIGGASSTGSHGELLGSHSWLGLHSQSTFPGNLEKGFFIRRSHSEPIRSGPGATQIAIATPALASLIPSEVPSPFIADILYPSPLASVVAAKGIEIDQSGKGLPSVLTSLAQAQPTAAATLVNPEPASLSLWSIVGLAALWLAKGRLKAAV
jgi:hypothetical protein